MVYRGKICIPRAVGTLNSKVKLCRYIYLPVIGEATSLLARLCASAVCFSFVYVWHGKQQHMKMNLRGRPAQVVFLIDKVCRPTPCAGILFYFGVQTASLLVRMFHGAPLLQEAHICQPSLQSMDFVLIWSCLNFVGITMEGLARAVGRNTTYQQWENCEYISTHKTGL